MLLILRDLLLLVRAPRLGRFRPDRVLNRQSLGGHRGALPYFLVLGRFLVQNQNLARLQRTLKNRYIFSLNCPRSLFADWLDLWIRFLTAVLCLVRNLVLEVSWFVNVQFVGL